MRVTLGGNSAFREAHRSILGGGLCVKGWNTRVFGSRRVFTWSEAACPRMIIWEVNLPVSTQKQ